jgi:uncharacterized membrane protein
MAPALILGLVAYATYELTSLSIMQARAPSTTALDIASGTVLTAGSVSIGLAIARNFGQA